MRAVRLATTLFNALIMSGVTVNKVHQHSLASSYVAPSFDAMVSSVSDLVFTNETGGRIFIVAYGTDSEATVEIYRPAKRVRNQAAQRGNCAQAFLDAHNRGQGGQVRRQGCFRYRYVCFVQRRRRIDLRGVAGLLSGRKALSNREKSEPTLISPPKEWWSKA